MTELFWAAGGVILGMVLVYALYRGEFVEDHHYPCDPTSYWFEATTFHESDSRVLVTKKVGYDCQNEGCLERHTEKVSLGESTVEEVEDALREVTEYE
jgi:hypothetical protein